LTSESRAERKLGETVPDRDSLCAFFRLCKPKTGSRPHVLAEKRWSGNERGPRSFAGPAIPVVKDKLLLAWKPLNWRTPQRAKEMCPSSCLDSEQLNNRVPARLAATPALFQKPTPQTTAQLAIVERPASQLDRAKHGAHSAISAVSSLQELARLDLGQHGPPQDSGQELRI
jgi:hypothetical protein